MISIIFWSGWKRNLADSNLYCFFFPVCCVGLHVQLSKTGTISRLHEFVSPVRFLFFKHFIWFILGKGEGMCVIEVTEFQAILLLWTCLCSLRLPIKSLTNTTFFLILGRISSGTASWISFAMSCFGCSGCCRDVEKEWSLLDKSGTRLMLNSGDPNDRDLNGVCKCFSVAFLMVVLSRAEIGYGCYFYRNSHLEFFLFCEFRWLCFTHCSFWKRHRTCL